LALLGSDPVAFMGHGTTGHMFEDAVESRHISGLRPLPGIDERQLVADVRTTSWRSSIPGASSWFASLASPLGHGKPWEESPAPWALVDHAHDRDRRRVRPEILGCLHVWVWSMVVAGEADDRPVVAGTG